MQRETKAAVETVVWVILYPIFLLRFGGEEDFGKRARRMTWGSVVVGFVSWVGLAYGIFMGYPKPELLFWILTAVLYAAGFGLFYWAIYTEEEEEEKRHEEASRNPKARIA